MTSDVLGLPELAENQAGKFVTHNESLAQLEAVLVRALTRADSDPASPADGDVHIVKPGASGAFSGHDNAVAHRLGGAWVFYSVPAGLRLLVVDEATVYRRTSSGWTPLAALPSMPVRTITADTTLTTSDRGAVILVDTSGGDVTVTLPAAADAGPDFSVAVVKSTSDGNVVTLAAASGEEIDWSASKELSDQGSGTLVVCDGAGQWIPVGGGSGGGGAVAPTVASVTDSGGGVTIDRSTSTVYELILEADGSVSLAGAPTSGAYGSVTVHVRQDLTGGRSVTWPSAVRWPGGSAPALSSAPEKVDIIELVTYDGGSIWYGEVRAQNLQGPGTPYADVVIADSPDAYYRLEGDPLSGGNPSPVDDSSGNGNTGDLWSPSDSTLGAAVISGPGSGGQSVDFAGGSNIDAGVTPTSYPYTVEQWFAGTSTADDHGLFWMNTDGDAQETVILASTGTVRAQIASYGTLTASAEGSTNVLDGNRHHIVTVWAASDDVRLYVDGSLEASMSPGVTMPSPYGLKLGESQQYSAVGRLDELAIYLSELSESRISLHSDLGRR